MLAETRLAQTKCLLIWLAHPARRAFCLRGPVGAPAPPTLPRYALLAIAWGGPIDVAAPIAIATHLLHRPAPTRLRFRAMLPCCHVAMLPCCHVGVGVRGQGTGAEWLRNSIRCVLGES